MTNEIDGDGDEGEAEQSGFLAPDTPEWAVVPPADEEFANATWLMADDAMRALVEEVLGYEEMAEVAAAYNAIVWRRHTKPKRGEERVLATVTLTDTMTMWLAYQREMQDWPRFVINLHWQHFYDLRDEGRYVHGEELQQHIHHALAGLEVDNDRIKAVQPPFVGHPATVKRYGMWTPGLRPMRQQMDLWPGDGDGPA